MSVCVYVRLFAVLAYLKTHMSKLHEIFSVYLIFYRGALLFRTIMQYVPVLWMALFFFKQWGIHHKNIFQRMHTSLRRGRN